MDKEHAVALMGGIEALKASTLRLPVLAGAIVCAYFVLLLSTVFG